MSRSQTSEHSVQWSYYKPISFDDIAGRGGNGLSLRRKDAGFTGLAATTRFNWTQQQMNFLSILWSMEDYWTTAATGHIPWWSSVPVRWRHLVNAIKNTAVSPACEKKTWPYFPMWDCYFCSPKKIVTALLIKVAPVWQTYTRIIALIITDWCPRSQF